METNWEKKYSSSLCLRPLLEALNQNKDFDKYRNRIENAVAPAYVAFVDISGFSSKIKDYETTDVKNYLKEYYENGSIGEKGTLRRLTPYVNGKKDGLVKEYYQNGQIWRTTNYKKGKREGKQIEYSAKTGKVISTAIFKNDELVGDKKCSDGRFGSIDLDCTPLNE